MFIKQIKLSKMETFCYLAGDDRTKTAALIDPAFDTGRIMGMANEWGYTITHVINTHCHSDHTAGNQAVIAATGAQLLIHTADAAKLTTIVNSTFSKVLGGKRSPKPDVLLQDDDEIVIGETILKTIHTPGHTPGGICLYAPGHVFTGDTLFVEAVGRTDLPGGSSRQLLQSIREKLYTLPVETIVWPGHDYGPTRRSSIDYEKRHNGFTL
ncbi:MAG: MBL fold metallo-hydrolase [bacterium]|nr:MBL fold metallo-hydrolase [bacterium]